MKPEITDQIFKIKDRDDFRECALEIFRHQAATNKVYSEFMKNLHINPLSVKSTEEIPFMPVEFFRTREVISGDLKYRKIFESSGTTGAASGKHYVADTGLYESSFRRSFSLFYGSASEYMIAALLPSYTERENSSLIYMMDNLIKSGTDPLSGFYKPDDPSLIPALTEARDQKRKVLLMGVSFALLDLAEKHSPDLHDVIVMETGGMKGKRKEVTRMELHSILMKAFNVRAIHSEYGMTELLSQAYSKGNGLFNTPPWMRIVIRDPLDPMSRIKQPGLTGGINIVDLANIHSCSFLSTGDLGKMHENGSFEVLGRLDNTDIRGCNLLIN